MILGISADPVKAQQKFAAKLGLPFQILSDVEHKTAEAYGVWIEKSLYGRTYFGIDRTTFLIDPKGRLSHIFPKVQIEGHAAQVLAVLQEAPGT